MQRPSLHLASDSLTTGTTPSVVHCDRFSLLPDDVLHVMLSFFGIVDLVRIRQCSRHLNHLSRARVVWLQQLRALCSYINLPPLALGPESLTNACLERYVTAHLRFTYNARRWSGHTEHQNVSLPSKASMRVNVLGYLDSPHDRITCIRFLPGGRYALVLSYSHLMLWDTGISVCAARCITSTRRPDLPDRTNITQQIYQVQQVRVSDDGKFVFNIVVRESVQHYANASILYSITPTSNQPQFRHHGTFSCPGMHLDACGFYGDMFLFLLWEGNLQSVGIHYFEKNVTFRWPSGLMVFDDLYVMPEHELLVATTVQMDTAVFFRVPSPPNDLQYTPGQVFIIERPYQFVRTWADQLDALGSAVMSIMPIRSTTSHSEGHLSPAASPMEWETIVKLADQRVVIIDQSMNFPTLASPGADIPTSWAPVVTRTCEFDQNELVAGRQDIPYSIIFQDGWRMMWWENFDTEDVLRFHLHDLNEPVPKTTSFSGILAQSRPEDKGKSLLCHSFYSVSAILGRGIYVSEDRTEFYVLDYDLPALPTQNNLSGSPCEDKQSKKKNRGLFRAKRIIKRMRKLLKLKNGN